MSLEAYAQQFGHAWLGEHLDSHVLQKLATRAYGAANRLRLCRAKRVRFKGQHQLDSVEGKTNTTGMRWCTDHLEWRGLVLPARLDPRDLVVVHGLPCPVKYARLVRRKLTAAPSHLSPIGLRGKAVPQGAAPAHVRSSWVWSL